MAKNQYGLPTLYGNQYGTNRQQFGYREVLNPFRQPNVGQMPPPQSGGRGNPPPAWNPPGTNQPPGGRGNGDGSGNGLGTLANPFGAGGAQPTQGGGAWYRPNPVGMTASYAYAPRQMPADTYVNPNSAAYRQSMGAFSPTGDNQPLWDVLPVQYKLTLSQWAAAGAGAYSQAYLDAMRAGSLGVVMDGKYMSGNDAAALIKSKADAYMNQLAQARQQGQPQPQPTPFRVGLQ